MSGDKLFYAEAPKGYVTKVIIDVLSSPLPRGIFTFNKKGIFLRQHDPANTVLFDVELPRENFRTYKCSRPLTLSFNLKHTQKLLRNVKKKDSITLFIDKGEDKLGIMVRPDGAGRVKSRFETNRVVFQEEKNHEPLDLPDGGYKYPIVIDAADFQKIKRLINVGKIITVKMQDDNYLSFRSDAGDVYDSELGFGELQSECDEGDTEQYDEAGEDDDEPKTGRIYEEKFFATLFNMLVKLPGLCTHMQFYAPTTDHFPLRIKMNAGQGGTTQGTFQVYIKDQNQINYEDSIRNENEQVVPLRSKGKGKKK